MVFLVKNFEKLKQKEWNFCGFVQKIQNIVIFCPFWLVSVQKQQYSQSFCLFFFPLPIAGKNGIGFLQSKEQKKVNKQANVRYQFTFVFILKICAKKGKIHFLWTVFLIFSKNNIFWNLKYFLWKCVSYLSKTICNSSCLTAMKLFQTQIKKSLFLNNQIGVKFAVSSQFAVLY